MSGKQLLPCPFCGKPPKYTVFCDGALHDIACMRRGCVVADVCEDTFKEAARRWNRRYSVTKALPKRTKTLEK